MRITVLLLLVSSPFIVLSQQKLKYTSDIEPLIKSGYSMANISKLEKYYGQSMGPDGKPSAQTLKLWKDQLHSVCKHLGMTYEKFAYANAKHPTYDTAIYASGKSAKWYQHIITDLRITVDTLPRHIQMLNGLKTAWNTEKNKYVSKIYELQDTLSDIMFKIAEIDKKTHTNLQAKYKNTQTLTEYEKAVAEAKKSLNDLISKKNAQEKQMKVAMEYKQNLMVQTEKNEKQNTFVQLQQQCKQENPCPDCPLEVAKKFREAYHNGDISAMQSLIIDYFNNKTLFYSADLNMYKDMTADEKKELSLQFKIKTSDFRKTDPENVVYYSDNEKRNFYIDKHYKTQLLHATVFKAINDYDKIDLVKWKGTWKVYRVGGAYAGRTGKSIVSGKFLVDPQLLKADE